MDAKPIGQLIFGKIASGKGQDRDNQLLRMSGERHFGDRRGNRNRHARGNRLYCSYATDPFA